MLLRQIKISQAKCNFCMQWMCLKTDVKFNINVCDKCLAQGIQDNNLRAISGQGVLYQLYMVKQNSFIEASNCERTVENWFGDADWPKIEPTQQQTQKTELLQQIDQFRNSQIKDILAKWNILTSFLNQKQSLSKEQIGYLKNICSQKSADLKKLHNEFTVNIISPKPNQHEIFDKITIIEPLEQEKQNFFKPLTSKKQNSKITSLIEDKQNFWNTEVRNDKFKDQDKQIQDIFVYKSPMKEPLGERDLNCVNVSLCSLSNLKQNNETYCRRLNTSFEDDSISISSNSLRGSFLLAQSSVRSSRANSVFNSIIKRMNSEQIKKFEATKNKIVKYLQKNYGSSSLCRLMFNAVYQAHENTSIVGKSLQLVSYNLSFTDFRCYLESFDWAGIEVLKLVKTKLSDDQFKILTDFISFNKLQIKVLVLTSNKLTQRTIQYLFQLNLDSIKEIYLGKNRITKGKVRDKIIAIRNIYSLYL